MRRPAARGRPARARARSTGARRFDHMQQHTGQHILSAAFDALHRRARSGSTSGPRSSTLDLDKALAPESIAAAEAEANRVVWEDRPVAIRFATADEAASLQLRKEPTRTGPLRIIEVAGFDRVGVRRHARRARPGQVGIIAMQVVGEVPRRHAAGVRVRRPRAARVPRAARRGRRQPSGSSPWRPPSCRRPSSGCSSDNKDSRRRSRPAGTARRARGGGPGGAGRARRRRDGRVEALDGWDQAGLKSLAAAAAALRASSRPWFRVAPARSSSRARRTWPSMPAVLKTLIARSAERAAASRTSPRAAACRLRRSR